MSFGIVRGPLTDPDWFAFYASPTRAWEFGIGALTLVWITKVNKAVAPALTALLWWVGAALLV